MDYIYENTDITRIAEYQFNNIIDSRKIYYPFFLYPNVAVIKGDNWIKFMTYLCFHTTDTNKPYYQLYINQWHKTSEYEAIVEFRKVIRDGMILTRRMNEKQLHDFVDMYNQKVFKLTFDIWERELRDKSMRDDSKPIRTDWENLSIGDVVFVGSSGACSGGAAYGIGEIVENITEHEIVTKGGVYDRDGKSIKYSEHYYLAFYQKHS